MQTPALHINTATALKLFVVSAAIVIALLCSLVVFGMRQDRLIRAQGRATQCNYLRNALQTAHQQAPAETDSGAAVINNGPDASASKYFSYLQQQIANRGCSG